MNSETKTCQNCKEDFTIDPEDFEFYNKISVPPPTFCWKCRFQRRLSFRNERHPFWGKSMISGKRIFSIFPPDSGVLLLDEDEWRSDQWDGLDYGAEYDFSRSFFEQFRELVKRVPRLGPHTEDNVNCEYLINSGWSKNCYMIFNCSGSEDCAYGNAVDWCKFCFDNSHVTKCERTYGSFWIRSCYQTHFSARSMECTSSWFLSGCKGMTNCFGCVNQINKSYCIYNVQYSKEEYQKRIAQMRLDTWSGLQKAKSEARSFAATFPIAYLNGILNDDVTGEYVSESKNVQYGYLVNGAKDVKYGQYLQVPGVEDSYDITIWGEKHIRGYENSTCGLGVSNSRFCEGSWSEVINSEYSIACRTISDCFGCIGLKKKQYCILNKQYTRDEYTALKAKIIEHMKAMPYNDKKGRTYAYGEFFPIEHSPIPYNLSLAQEHMPLTKEQALEQGYGWYDMRKKEYEVTMAINAVPDAIGDVSDTIIKEILECGTCRQPYRIIALELAFLKAEKLPLPRQCMECRHEERIVQRAKAFLYPRKCDCTGKTPNPKTGYENFATHPHGEGSCPVEFEAAYPPEDPRIIYCLKCFYPEAI